MGINYIQTSNQPPPVFTVDGESSDDRWLYIKVKDKGTVVIENREDGLEASIYPLDVEEGTLSVADMSVTNDELIKKEEE